MKERKRASIDCNGSSTSSAERSPCSNPPAEDSYVMFPVSDSRARLAPSDLRWETPSVPSTCEQSGSRKHSSQLTKPTSANSSGSASTQCQWGLKSKSTKFLFTLLSSDSATSHYIHGRDAHNNHCCSVNGVTILMLKSQKDQCQHPSLLIPRETAVRCLSPWRDAPSWLTPTRSPQGKMSRDRPRPHLHTSGEICWQMNPLSTAPPSLMREGVVGEHLQVSEPDRNTMEVETSYPGHWGRSTSGGRESLGSTQRSQYLQLKPPQFPSPDGTAVKVLVTDLSVVRSQQKHKVLKNPALQASPLETYRRKGEKVVAILCCCSRLPYRCWNVQLRTLSKPAARSSNVAMRNAKSFITEKFPAASLENELFPVTKAKLSHAKRKKKGQIKSAASH